MRKVGYLIDERFRLHDTGPGHHEAPNRLTWVQQALDGAEIALRWQRLEGKAATYTQLERVHLRAHIDRVVRACESAPGFLDPDTPVSPGSLKAALWAAGSVLACTDAICRGEIERAFAFVRPPGHHAEPDRAMGFCLFNNIAVAAAYLRSEHALERVAIVDFDVHHGNGTQRCFYQDPSVLFISTHQFPFYPGTGLFSQTGRGEGWGTTVNFPLPAGAGDGVFVPIYSRIVGPILRQFQPQFILVSAGFDAYLGDPLGGLAVTAPGFASVAASLLRAADECCGGRICFVLEGGYSPTGLRESITAVMAQMESENPEELPLPGDALFETIANQAEGEFGEHWQW